MARRRSSAALLAQARRRTYSNKMSARLGAFTFGAQWPLDDASGGVARAVSATASLTGTYNADITLAHTLGPSGKKVAHSGGSGGYIWLLSDALISAWSTIKSEGGFGCWIKADTGIWTNGVGYIIQWLQTDGNNTIYLTKAADNNLYWSANRGGVLALAALAGYKPAGWFHLFLTWSETNNRVRAYLNGEKFSEAATGTWAGNPNSFILYTLDLATSWPGCADTYIVTGGREPTPGEVRALVNDAAHIARIAIIGDSISRFVGDGTEWPWIVGYTHNSSLATVINHAEAAMGILAGDHNLAYQASAAASDDADVIIIALGTNDDNAEANQEALQEALGAGIDALRASNPRARIHTVAVWPNYADAQLDNIRESIVAVSAAKNVVSHDPTDVWAENESTDGWHPNAAGHAKAATWVLGWL